MISIQEQGRRFNFQMIASISVLMCVSVIGYILLMMPRIMRVRGVVMKAIVRNLRVGAVLGSAVLTAGPILAQATPAEPLHLNVVRVQKTAGPPLFEVRLHNAGDRPLILNLGTMGANGRQQYLEAIQLRLADEHGKVMLLHLTGPAIAPGQIDPMVMPLPEGAIFSFPVKLADYHSPGENIWKIALAPGRYTLSAEYKGSAVPQRGTNLDMQGLALMPYWTGFVQSKALSFKVR